MALTIGELVGYLKIDRSHWTRGIEFAKRSLASVGDMVAQVGARSSLAVLAAQGVQAAAAIAPVSGALLAIPAAAAVAGMALATVKIATKGVGDAMSAMATGDAKQIEAALGKLTPEARAFVKAWSGLQQSFKPIQQAVQDAFFADLNGDINVLARTALPGLKQGLMPVAGSLNALVREGVQAASTPMFSGMLAQVGRITAMSLDHFRGVAGPLAATLNNLVRVGMPLVLRLSEMAAAALKARLAFWGSEAGSDAMEAALDKGAATAGRMASIMGNLSAILAGVFGAAGVTVGARDLLGTIDALTARAAEWVASTSGQSTLAATFEQLNAVGAHAVVVLQQVLSVVGTLMGFMDSLPPGVQGAVTEFMAWSIVLGPIASKLTMLGTVVFGFVGHLGTAAAAVWKFAFVNKTAAGTTRAAWLLAKLSVVGSWLAMAAAATVSAARTAAVATASAIRAAVVWVASHAAMLASTLATAAGVVAGWVLMGVQSLLQAARMAAAWLIAMGPVGWVIAAVIALVALIIANWDTVKRVTIQVWEWIWFNVIKPIWDAILAYAQWWLGNVLAVFDWFKELPGRIAGWYGAVYNAIVDKLTQAIEFVRSVPGRILEALGNLGNLLKDAGRAVIQGLIDGIKSMIGNLGNVASSVAQTIADRLPGSPVKKGPLTVLNGGYAGRQIIGMLADGVGAGQGSLARSMNRAIAMATPAGVGALPGGAPGAGLSGMFTSPGGGTQQTIRIVHDYTGATDELMQILQKRVRTDYGGDPDAAWKGGV